MVVAKVIDEAVDAEIARRAEEEMEVRMIGDG